MITPHAFGCRCEGCIVKYFQPTHDASPTQGADARPVAIYQGRVVGDTRWDDLSKDAHDHMRNKPQIFETRIVYATRDAAPSDAAIDALKWIKVLVCGDSAPRWTNAHQTTISRGMIADMVDKAIAPKDKS